MVIDSATNVTIRNITAFGTVFGSSRCLNILSTTFIDIDYFHIINSTVEMNNLIYISETKNLNFINLQV